MNIQERYLTRNIFSRPGTPLGKVRGIVVHWVANPGTGAIANRNYFESLKSQPQATAGQRNKGRYASAHFIVGLEGEVVQCLLEDEMAYHVGAVEYSPLALRRLSAYPNSCTLGIELCHINWEGEFTKETLRAAKELIAELCERYSLTAKDVYRHYDITGKDCPRYFVKNEDKWSNFLESLENV
jgi:N-acetylmuramoyl-L-alanine amidase